MKRAFLGLSMIVALASAIHPSVSFAGGSEGGGNLLNGEIVDDQDRPAITRHEGYRRVVQPVIERLKRDVPSFGEDFNSTARALTWYLYKPEKLPTGMRKGLTPVSSSTNCLPFETTQGAYQNEQEVWIDTTKHKGSVAIGKTMLHEIALNMANGKNDCERHIKTRAFMRTLLKKPEVTDVELAQAANQLVVKDASQLALYWVYRRYRSTSEIAKLEGPLRTVRRTPRLMLYPGCLALQYARTLIERSPVGTTDGDWFLRWSQDHRSASLLFVELQNAYHRAANWLRTELPSEIDYDGSAKGEATLLKVRISNEAEFIRSSSKAFNDGQFNLYNRMSQPEAASYLNRPFLTRKYEQDTCRETLRDFATDPEFVAAKATADQSFREKILSPEQAETLRDLLTPF